MILLIVSHLSGISMRRTPTPIAAIVMQASLHCQAIVAVHDRNVISNLLNLHKFETAFSFPNQSVELKNIDTTYCELFEWHYHAPIAVIGMRATNHKRAINNLLNLHRLETAFSLPKLSGRTQEHWYRLLWAMWVALACTRLLPLECNHRQENIECITRTQFAIYLTCIKLRLLSPSQIIW